MFWKKKDKKQELSAETEIQEELTSEAVDEEERFDVDEDVEDGEYDEIVEAEPTDKNVLLKVGSLEELAKFANRRGNGNMQFMTKDTNEVFELRESHFRIAEVLGTVTMARECSAEEYAKVVLATELLADKDAYYTLPGLTEAEVKEAVENFCRDNFSVSGKRYSHSPERFARLLKENDRREEWDEYTLSLVYDKLEVFCDKNGIVFDVAESKE